MLKYSEHKQKIKLTYNLLSIIRKNIQNKHRAWQDCNILSTDFNNHITYPLKSEFSINMQKIYSPL